ncbi:MAG: DNA polymerase I [bacterium]|nr:DNA polymerase I [bacterium]
MSRLFLIDGHSLAYRAFYAIPHLRNSKGQLTNAVYGFTTMLLKLLREESPDYLGVVFDSKGPTFRHREYSQYKATRERMPDEMRIQLSLIREVIDAFRIPCITCEGYEADDVIGTIVKRYRDQVDEIIIVSGDKDVLQLVDRKIKVMATKKGITDVVIYDEERVRDKFGVLPHQVVDVLALMGDQSDNVPGIPGIGEKTAKELIRNFGGLDEIFRRLDEVEEGLRKKILNGKEEACLSRRLVVIDTQVPLHLNLSECKVSDFDTTKLWDVLVKLEFKGLLKDLGLKGKGYEVDYRVIKEPASLSRLIDSLSSPFCIDLEITSQNPIQAQLVGIAISNKPYTGFYIPVDKTSCLDSNFVLQRLKPVLEDERIKKYGQNIKYGILVLGRYGIRLKGIDFDTMIASYVLNPETNKHALEDIALKYLGERKDSYKELFGQVPIKDVPIKKIFHYACSLTDTTFRLVDVLKQKIMASGVDSLFREIEMPLIEVLADMEMTGIKVDTDYLKKMSRDLGKRITELIHEIYQLAEEEFNPNSHKQLSHIFFEKLHLPIIKRTKTGYSTDEEVLRRLSEIHPLPRLLLEYRELTKLKSTYVDALFNIVNPETKRVHTSFNQSVTSTGRLSSSDPNLQNIPIRIPLGKEIRKAFIPENCDYTLLSCDYSQIELRILAHISRDQSLTQAFRQEKDIHTQTAKEVFGVDVVTPDLRRKAKVVNFGIVYGMSCFGLSKELGITPKEAEEIINKYFERFAGVKQYIEWVINFARENGYVKTLWGRIRYLPDINSKNRNVRELAERTAINTPIQGSAADLMKIAMINVRRALKDKKTKMLLQVHDELLFEAPKSELHEVVPIIKRCMEDIRLEVPIKVNVASGKNWGEIY